MKKILSSILVAALVLTIGTVSALAANSQNGKNDDKSCILTNYADENGDGICDNRTEGSVCSQDGTGRKNGNGNTGTNVVDSNSDGVCDNRTEGSVCSQDGTGGRRGGRNR